MTSWRGMGAAVVLGGVVAGCGLFGKGGEPQPAPIDVVIAAAPRLNPDDSGESLPTVVRVYQLKSGAKLEGAGFDEIYGAAKDVLGDDLLELNELVLPPGGRAEVRLERDKAARVLGVVSVVRRPAGKSWRMVVDLPPAKDRSRLTFLVEGYRIERR